MTTINTDIQKHADPQQRSAALQDQLRLAIAAAGGTLRFDEFMQRVLYTPGQGYYACGENIFGRGGDFITAPEIAPLFAQCLANSVAVVLPHLSQRTIYEAGGGSGQLTCDLLQSLIEKDCVPEHYYVIEISPGLREQQRARLQQNLPQLLERVTWLETLPAAIHGMLIANELLDAMPVRQFVRTAAGVSEAHVSVVNDQLQLISQATQDTRLLDRVKQIENVLGERLPAGYTSEVNFAAEDWLAQLANKLQQGVALLIDYGYPRTVFYHPQRGQGTLVCHYQHTVNSNPLAHIGLQDITAFVDFTAMAAVAQQAGMAVAGFTTQAHFLLDTGILQLPQVSAEQIKRLTLPHEMGEAFKVLALCKDYHGVLPGFGFRNRASELLA